MSDTVDITVSGFQAITEFAGANDDCGPCAEEVCLACVQKRDPSTGHMNEIRARDIPRGWFTPHNGNTLHDVFLDATEIEHVAVTETPLWSQAEVIRENLKAALLRGNPCVLNLANASALHGNEQGVKYHFVAVGGINSTQGYLIANGDAIPFGPATWHTWGEILGAQPIGLLEFHMPESPPPAPEGSTYVVQAGDTLSKIAAAKYGNAAQWPAIWQANHQLIGSNPNIIQAGWKLVIPPLGNMPPPPEHRTVTVYIGDSLASIAASVYGNAARWSDIWRANMSVIGPNPNLIKPGEVLAIP